MNIWDKTFLQMHQWGVAQIDFNDGITVLDIGAGSGQSSRLLVNIPQVSKVIASDFSEEAVSRMKQTLKNPKIEIIQASVTELSYADNTFDVVTAFQTHFHWHTFEEGMNEVYRVLKPGGVCAIVSESDKPKYHLKAYDTQDKMVAYLKSLGFSDVKTSKQRNWMSYFVKK